MGFGLNEDGCCVVWLGIWNYEFDIYTILGITIIKIQSSSSIANISDSKILYFNLNYTLNE